MKEEGKVLKLGNTDIRRISTSQVIASIGGACRELIDNSLDANATTIEIRASEYGVTKLEVLDNGSGIMSSNFNALCKPHSTSKLSKFEDFDRLLTFGFRGEALNALSSLSDLTIITKHRDELTATRMKFNEEGEMIEKSSCARPTGTTVILSHMFSRLPVRQKQFKATAKEQFQKLLNNVQAFALARTDVRFIVKNTIGSKVNQMLATAGGNTTLKSVVTNLFGARSEKESMLEIKDATPDNEILETYGLPSLKAGETAYENVRIHGYVSSCEFGCGRSSADRQFIFINGRPVDYSKMCKVANEVYSSFNRGHYCTLICFIDLDPGFIDVNVTPDKRSVFLKIEKEVFAKLRACLLATFKSIVGQLPVSRVVEKTQTQLNLDRSSVEKENVTNDLISDIFSRPLSTLLPKGNERKSTSKSTSKSTPKSTPKSTSKSTSKTPDFRLESDFRLASDFRLSSDFVEPDKPCIEHSHDMLEDTQECDVEKKLSMMLKKEDFDKMEIVGQFNKAFILTRLDQNLFIIDQHASDEKFNFERLQQTHKIEQQHLITPKSLEVGAIYEAVISDNLEVFQANGFDFSFHESEEPGRRIKLVSIPVLHGHMFGQNDIEEIASVLNSYPGTMYRPEKIRKIFASWACRRSIMIGKALKNYEMVRIVKNMGTIDNPWSCPHGRPAIRHLCELKFPLILPNFLDANNAEQEEHDEISDVIQDRIEPEFRPASDLDLESQIF